MRSVRWANRIAAAAAAGILIFAFGYLRLRSWVPLAGALIVYVSFLWMLWPRRDPVVQVLPEGISAEEYRRARARLQSAAQKLRRFAVDSDMYDKRMFREMADLMDTLCDHVQRNPMHLRTARRFFRHALDRMIRHVSDYMDLLRRDLPEHRGRLHALSEQMENFVIALRDVDRACLENDLTALEISVEVLNEQLDRQT